MALLNPKWLATNMSCLMFGNLEVEQGHQIHTKDHHDTKNHFETLTYCDHLKDFGFDFYSSIGL
jgi:hypothetical protein